MTQVRSRVGWLLTALLLTVTGQRDAQASGPDPYLLADLSDAIKDARVSAKGERKAIERLQAAMRPLTAHAGAARTLGARGLDKARGELPLASRWNDAVTVLRWHGATAPPYVHCLESTFANDAGLHLSFPLGTRWTHRYSGKSEQHLMTLVQKSAGGAVLSMTRIHIYRWDTLYDGVGGENYVKLAKVMLDLDRELMAGRGWKASDRVMTVALNAAFPRSQYYFVEGDDPELEARVRRHNYYIKDDRRTYWLELIQFVERTACDDAVSAWQRTDADPERAALLKTLSSSASKTR